MGSSCGSHLTSLVVALALSVDSVVMGKSLTVVDASFCNCSYLCFGIRINSVAITQVLDLGKY